MASWPVEGAELSSRGHGESSGVRVEVAPVASALQNADPTRRFGLRIGTRSCFGGLTRPEAVSLQARVERGLAEEAADTGEPSTAIPDRLLVQVELPAILSDGAGPHLLDADGRLVLALGRHPAVVDAHVAMGEPRPWHPIGLVAPRSGGSTGNDWEWVVRREVEPAERVSALDALHALETTSSAVTWAEAGRGKASR